MLLGFGNCHAEPTADPVHAVILTIACGSVQLCCRYAAFPYAALYGSTLPPDACVSPRYRISNHRNYLTWYSSWILMLEARTVVRTCSSSCVMSSSELLAKRSLNARQRTR